MFNWQFGLSDELLLNGLKCLWVFMLGQEKREQRCLWGPEGRHSQLPFISTLFLILISIFKCVFVSFCVSPPHSSLCCNCCALFRRLKLLPCTKCADVSYKRKKFPLHFSRKTFSVFSFWFTLYKTKSIFMWLHITVPLCGQHSNNLGVSCFGFPSQKCCHHWDFH